MKFDLLDTKGKKIDGLDLVDSVWTESYNEDLVAQCVFVYKSNKRSGDANAKTRAQVRGGGRKPWKQKGTGRARHGSIRSPLWVGGGVTFTPTNRNWKKRLPRKMKNKSLSIMLSKRLEEGNISFVKGLENAVRDDYYDVKGLTIVTADTNVFLKFRNMSNIKVINPVDMHVLDVVSARNLVVSEEAVAKLEERLIDGK